MPPSTPEETRSTPNLHPSPQSLEKLSYSERRQGALGARLFLLPLASRPPLTVSKKNITLSYATALRIRQAHFWSERRAFGNGPDEHWVCPGG